MPRDATNLRAPLTADDCQKQIELWEHECAIEEHGYLKLCKPPFRYERAKTALRQWREILERVEGGEILFGGTN